MPTQQRPVLRNGHDTHRGAGVAEAKCPYCGQIVSRREFEEIKGRIEAEETARISRVEESLKKRFASEMEHAQVKTKAEVEKVRRDAAKAAETQLRALRAGQEEATRQRLNAQRENLAKQTAEAINAEKVKAFEETTKLTQQLAEMQRRLERRTPHELGEPAEVDLFEQLEAAFPDDRISRVVKGVKGPDIIVEIVNNDAVVGSIAIDCKNHRRWLHTFTTKLRADQLAENADYAILSTSTFPKGARQLHIQDNVIVADPARVVVLLRLLRWQIVQNHALKLSAEGRDEKAGRLFAFVVSPACTDLLDRIVKLTADMADLDRTETVAHEKVWTKRADLIRRVQGVHAEFSAAVSRIIGGSEASI